MEPPSRLFPDRKEQNSWCGVMGIIESMVQCELQLCAERREVILSKFVQRIVDKILHAHEDVHTETEPLDSVPAK